MSGTDKQKVLYLLLLLFNRVYEKAQGIWCALFTGSTEYFRSPLAFLRYI